MATGINEFIKNFKGGARNDRFRVIINYPALVGTPNVADYLRINTAALPGSTISPAMVFFMGRQIPVLGDRQLEVFSMTVLNDVDFSHRNAFTKWLNLTMSHESNVQGTPDYHDLLGTMQIEQLDRDGETVLKVIKLHNIFPDMMSQVDLAYAAMDQVEEYQITVAYSHWTSGETT